MTFSTAVPDGTTTIAGNKPKFVANFTAMNTAFSADHTQFDSGVNIGKHKQVSFIGNFPAIPIPPTLSGITLLSNTSGSNYTLSYVENNGFSTSTEVQLTGKTPPIPITVPVAGQSSGCSNLPGGLMIQWGYIQAFGPGLSANIVFPRPFSVNPYSIVLTGIKDHSLGSGDGFFVETGSVSTTKFKAINTGGGAHDMYWMAIGHEV
jgi:hypothetical protein